MKIDIEKLEALAKGCRDEVIRSHGWTGMIADAGLLRRDSEFLKECSPEAVLDLIASGKRMAARLMYCPACQGQGEIYSGRNSYEGYNQPPEPIMGKCGECDGDGALGGTAECISILDELEALRASVHGLKTGYEACEQVNAELRAECEKLRKYGEEFASLAERRREQVEALRKDAERYQWLRDESESIHQFYLSTPIWFTGVKFSKENVDSTIDAAMSKEQSHD